MNEERRESAVPIGEVLARILGAKERESVRPMQRLQAAWARLQTRGRLEGTRVSAYAAKAVVIEVRSPPLCAELAQFRRRELLSSLRAELGGDPPLDEIKFRLGAW
ncbi:MAG: DUF721 domain-containing protein [Planctomycetes bacterium]|nr:DUF721 domain-containing protein [Planctomycetota bacterium]